MFLKDVSLGEISGIYPWKGNVWGNVFEVKPSFTHNNPTKGNVFDVSEKMSLNENKPKKVDYDVAKVDPLGKLVLAKKRLSIFANAFKDKNIMPKSFQFHPYAHQASLISHFLDQAVQIGPPVAIHSCYPPLRCL